jgi:hypothetical protein
MFASRLRVTLRGSREEKPVPKAWLDQFFMRNFTGYSAFDEILVVGDGNLEAGFVVDRNAVREQFEKWLRGRKMIPPEIRLFVEPRAR